jgi:hypothetical protein
MFPIGKIIAFGERRGGLGFARRVQMRPNPLVGDM